MKRMKLKNTDDPCRTLSDMVVEEVIRETGLKYGAAGMIPLRKLDAAREHILQAVKDFERSPAGPSTRNKVVLSMVKHFFTSRLRVAAWFLSRARGGGHSVAIEELREVAAHTGKAFDDSPASSMPAGVRGRGGAASTPGELLHAAAKEI
mgnify:CR=1 FL=1